MCARTDMSEACDPRLGVPDEGNGAPNFAQRPQGERKIQHRCGAGVLPEAERQIVVTPSLEQGESLFEMLPRFSVLSGKPMRHTGYAVCNSGLGRIGTRLDVA
jgi:hypothetical protein